MVFVIRKDFEADFREKILSKYEGHIPVEVVYQGLTDLPEGFTCPAERVKPWGTNHALLMGKNVINEPFAIINSDDYYGRNSFEVMASELSALPEGSTDHYSMVGFMVGNTMSESGTVARGVCETKDGNLTGVVDATQTKGLHGAFLAGGTANDASDLCDSKFLCHNIDLLYFNR